MAENRDQVALPAGFDTQDAEAVLRGVEGDALDQTGQTSVGVLVLGACGIRA
jgi:phage tail tube protein FII